MRLLPLAALVAGALSAALPKSKDYSKAGAPASAYKENGVHHALPPKPNTSKSLPKIVKNPSDIPSAKAQNQSVSPHVLTSAASCSLSISAQTSFWIDALSDNSKDSRGYAPYSSNPSSYFIYRNVLSDPFNAKNDGSGDQTQALQNAISTDFNGGDRSGNTGTTEPAYVFLPSGTYTIGSTLNLLINTVIIGDPNDPPTIKAAAGFNGGTFINGYDGKAAPETSFFTQLRNVILDTTAIDGGTSLTALQWGVAQGCALGNVKINMPMGSSAQVGINLKGGSTIAVTDTQINGGAIGIQNSNQQVNFKNIQFTGCTTAYAPTGGFTSILQSVTFDTCGFGVDMTKGNAAAVVLLDVVSKNSGDTVLYVDSSNTSGDRNNQIVIENLTHDNSNPIAVDSSNNVHLPASSHIDTWAWGNADPGNYQTGMSATTPRTDALTDASGNFFTMDAPTFEGISADQVVNVKAVAAHPVKGDGSTDDSASLNAILADNAANCKVTFFPYGIYIVKDTLVIPPNSRIVGQAWPAISGAGSKFSDASNPVPVVQVGNSNVGTTGVAQISDMRFSVAEVSPGAIIMENNMSGNKGDVGLWNSLILVGGTADTTVTQNCNQQDTSNCMAAFAGLHLTSSSSVYVQNLWVWTADHSLDGGPNQIISTGRGILVEATKGTWLTGTGSEHNWLYNYNFHNSQNVMTSMMQTETPYMQGDGATKLAPAPWTADAAYGDPDFSWCGGGDGKCRSSLAVNVDGGSDVHLHSSGSWAFFHGPWDGSYSATSCGSDTCQSNMNRVANSPSTFTWYGINTKAADTMVLDGKNNPQSYNNPGGWDPHGGNLVAYVQWA